MSQTLLAFITALPVVLDRPVFHFNWTVALVVTGVSGLVSLLTSICSTAVGTNGPSLTGAEHLDYTKNGST